MVKILLAVLCLVAVLVLWPQDDESSEKKEATVQLTKSSRSAQSLDRRSGELPASDRFAQLESRYAMMESEELWGLIDQFQEQLKTNADREIQLQIAMALRELGKREGEDALLKVDELYSEIGPNYLQMRATIMAGWGIVDPEKAAAKMLEEFPVMIISKLLPIDKNVLHQFSMERVVKELFERWSSEDGVAALSALQGKYVDSHLMAAALEGLSGSLSAAERRELAQGILERRHSGVEPLGISFFTLNIDQRIELQAFLRDWNDPVTLELSLIHI